MQPSTRIRATRAFFATSGGDYNTATVSGAGSRVPGFRFQVLARLVHISAGMAGARSPEEFDAWRLAWDLKEGVCAFTATGPAACDRKFCEEIRKAARSAPDNIAEGFYRFNPTDFANFARIARGSLGEIRNQLKHAHSKNYLSDTDFDQLFRLCGRAIGATTGLRLYLLSCPKNFDPRKLEHRERNRGRQREPAESEPSEPER
jgi:four helix bundle protein